MARAHTIGEDPALSQAYRRNHPATNMILYRRGVGECSRVFSLARRRGLEHFTRGLCLRSPTRIGEVDGAHVKAVVLLGRVLQASCREHIDRRESWSKVPLFLRRDDSSCALVAVTARDDLEEYFTSCSTRGMSRWLPHSVLSFVVCTTLSMALVLS